MESSASQREVCTAAGEQEEIQFSIQKPALKSPLRKLVSYILHLFSLVLRVLKQQFQGGFNFKSAGHPFISEICSKMNYLKNTASNCERICLLCCIYDITVICKSAVLDQIPIFPMGKWLCVVLFSHMGSKKKKTKIWVPSPITCLGIQILHFPLCFRNKSFTCVIWLILYIFV